MQRWGNKKEQEQQMGNFGIGERNEKGQRLVQYAYHQNL